MRYFCETWSEENHPDFSDGAFAFVQLSLLRPPASLVVTALFSTLTDAVRV